MIRIKDLTGAALGAALDSLADLRIAVFRDFPYLYDGSGAAGRAYEQDYLTAYAQSPGALIVGALADDGGGERLIAHYDWKDVGEAANSAHPMQFWLKHLD